MKRLIILIALLVSSCANPFVKFYQDRTNGIDVASSQFFVPPSGEPKLYRGTDPQSDPQRMIENGYALVGFSSFNGGNINMDNALTQAKNVHAALVLVYSKYTGTRSGSIPLTLPDIQTSTTNLSGSVYGSGGYGNFYGTANTTTYGTKTMYIPYNVDRYDCLATYWIKTKPPVFGVSVKDLTPEIRQSIGSNKGLLVNAVIKNSPAFRADILKGDILKKINDTELFDQNSFREIVRQFEGQKVIVTILREGKEIQKEIQLDRLQ